MASGKEKGQDMKYSWQRVQDARVYVDDQGRVQKAVRLDSNGSTIPAMPYRWSKAYQCWVKAKGVRIATLRSGMSRGTYAIK